MEISSNKAFLVVEKIPHALSALAYDLVADTFGDLVMHKTTKKRGGADDSLNKLIEENRPDFLFNFLGSSIISRSALEAVAVEALNFHPGPPAWPGVGSVAMALMRGDREFGATCHRMTLPIDSGEIILSRLFAVSSHDTPDYIFAKSQAHCYLLLQEVMSVIKSGHDLTASGDIWGRPPVTRREFESHLEVLRLDATDEFLNKIWALTYPGKQAPFVRIGENVFRLAE